MRFDSAGVQGSPSPLPSTRAQDKSSPVPGKTCVDYLRGRVGNSAYFLCHPAFFPLLLCLSAPGQGAQLPLGGKEIEIPSCLGSVRAPG